MSKPGPRTEFFFDDDNIEMRGIDNVIHPAASQSLDNGIRWKAASNGHREMLCSLCNVWIDLGKTIMGEVGMVNR